MKKLPLIVVFLLFLSGCLQKSEMDKLEDFKVVIADEKNFKDFLNRLESGGYTPLDVKKSYTPTLESSLSKEEAPIAIERYSRTNVQVEGIDEGDIVKSDGRYIYFSPEADVKIMYHIYPPPWRRKTYIVEAFPPASAGVVGNISHGGILYLSNHTLVVIERDKILGYDVSSPRDPRLKWKIDIDGTYVDSRLYSGKLYLVVRKREIKYPLPWMDTEIKNYYIPILPSTVSYNFQDSYIVSAIDLDSGNISKVVALPGSRSTVVYMSKNRIYLAYYLGPNIKRLYLQFLEENLDKYFPEDVRDILRHIIDSKYFSDDAKFLEVKRVINNYLRTLEGEEALNLRNTLEKDFEKYLEEHWEELEKTGIVGIDIDTFQVKSGSVPGRLVNSYAMDEYRGYLRVATTVGDYWRYRDRSTNNIYVLKDLEVYGKLTGLARGERIYGVRFMGDVAYLVTYREKDPLFVIDLSDPRNPKLLGKLKIPGYSTYLHPIDDSRLIGVGRDERGNLKVSLFNVENKTNPIEVDRFILPKYWSPVLYNPHAFLWDEENRIFVIPTGDSCYIFRIKGDRISLEMEDVHRGNVLRSLYINHYLYTLSNKEIHVIDMGDWKVVKKVIIQEPRTVWINN
ncbi:beta-propeller domain-containing protein [Methanothermococcus sp. SCGC AD-155-E23]|nr:beta-propeller domain-containing protein [Methanothermococcus sp. SCGC AD-155-E23]